MPFLVATGTLGLGISARAFLVVFLHSLDTIKLKYLCSRFTTRCSYINKNLNAAFYLSTRKCQRTVHFRQDSFFCQINIAEVNCSLFTSVCDTWQPDISYSCHQHVTCTQSTNLSVSCGWTATVAQCRWT